MEDANIEDLLSVSNTIHSMTDSIVIQSKKKNDVEK